jgi:hypothetical protein
VTSLDVAVNGDQTVHDRQRLANMGDLRPAVITGSGGQTTRPTMGETMGLLWAYKGRRLGLV